MSVLSKDFLQDLSSQLERFVMSYEFNRNGWNEGLILCFSLSGSALLSKSMQPFFRYYMNLAMVMILRMLNLDLQSPI